MYQVNSAVFSASFFVDLFVQLLDLFANLVSILGVRIQIQVTLVGPHGLLLHVVLSDFEVLLRAQRIPFWLVRRGLHRRIGIGFGLGRRVLLFRRSVRRRILCQSGICRKAQPHSGQQTEHGHFTQKVHGVTFSLLCDSSNRGISCLSYLPSSSSTNRCAPRRFSVYTTPPPPAFPPAVRAGQYFIS